MKFVSWRRRKATRNFMLFAASLMVIDFQTEFMASYSLSLSDRLCLLRCHARRKSSEWNRIPHQMSWLKAARLNCETRPTDFTIKCLTADVEPQQCFELILISCIFYDYRGNCIVMKARRERCWRMSFTTASARCCNCIQFFHVKSIFFVAPTGAVI